MFEHVFGMRLHCTPLMEYRNGVLHIGGFSVEEIAERYGTPLYLYDEEVIRRQISLIRESFTGLPFRPFFAMKANSSLAILRLIQSAGFGCDAVSPGEIFIARQAGFESNDIWFTCSNVSDEDLRSVADAAIVINVNSMSEIDRCLTLDLPNPIALRVNPDIGAGHHHDVVTAGDAVKFGIDLAEIESARQVVEDSGRRVVGLHAHIGSGIDDVAPLLESARRLLELVTDFPNLKWVNFGGGFSIPYQPGQNEFPIRDYGAALAHMAGSLLRARDLTAILEPGRYVTAPAGTLLGRVTALRISGGLEWAGCDTGFNHLVRPSRYGAYHHILNASRGTQSSLRASWEPSNSRCEYVVAGNLCESGDVFTRDLAGRPQPRALDPLRIGDLLAFCDAGAYGFSMASHYNARLLPPELLAGPGGIRQIRARQTFADLLRGQE